MNEGRGIAGTGGMGGMDEEWLSVCVCVFACVYVHGHLWSLRCDLYGAANDGSGGGGKGLTC